MRKRRQKPDGRRLAAGLIAAVLVVLMIVSVALPMVYR